MENFFTALADITRLRILNLMRGEQISVGYFAEILAVPQPKISRHLAYLRESGIVETTRDGKWIYYRIVEIEDKNTALLLKNVLNYLAADAGMKFDRERLEQFRSALKALPVLSPQMSRENELQETDRAAESFKTETERQELAVYLL